MKLLRFLRRECLQILILALPFALAAGWWSKIPPRVVCHWDLHGHPDGMIAKVPGVLGVPLLNAAVCVFIALAPWIDPRLRRNPSAHTARQRWLLRKYRHAISGFGSLTACFLVANALGWRIMDVVSLGYYGTLLLFAVVGNFLGSLEPSYLMGLRTPWTLEDASTWRATHRLTGRWMLFGAAGLMGIGFAVPEPAKLLLVLAYVFALGAWSVSYSAWFFQRQQKA